MENPHPNYILDNGQFNNLFNLSAISIKFSTDKIGEYHLYLMRRESLYVFIQWFSQIWGTLKTILELSRWELEQYLKTGWLSSLTAFDETFPYLLVLPHLKTKKEYKNTMM